MEYFWLTDEHFTKIAQLLPNDTRGKERVLRSATARTIPDLWAAIRQAFTRFTPQECCNDLAAAGYEDGLAVAT